jgi:CheY-like chemotaxis protein
MPDSRDSPGADKTVLLVEDNPVNQQVMLMLLSRAGFTVEVAGNGREALEAFEKRPFSLVLMDVQMPEMDGIRATRLIRAREKVTGGHVPIIAVTANALPGERQRCLAAGMDDYLAKPVRTSELFPVIERVLHRSQESGVRGQEDSASSLSPEKQPAWAPSLSGMSVPPDAVRKLVQTFVETVPQRLGVLRQAVTEANAKEVERSSHSLRGSLAVFSARAAVEAAADLELAGRGGQLEGAADLLRQLEAQVEPLLASMNEFLRTSGER